MGFAKMMIKRGVSHNKMPSYSLRYCQDMGIFLAKKLGK
jgi:hypothetical protein